MAGGKKIRSRTTSTSTTTTQNNIPNRPLNIKNHMLSSTNINNFNHNHNNKSIDELLAMTKEQLKNECRKRGQKTNGNKIELLQRLGIKMATIKKKETLQQQSNGSASSGIMQHQSPNASGTTTTTLLKSNLNESMMGGNGDSPIDRSQKEKEKLERLSIVLWKRPFLTIEYFLKEVIALAQTYGKRLLSNKKLVILTLFTLLSSYLLVNIEGPHQKVIAALYKQILWCSYWIGLGILSSVGLGTGLHTFLLYLGPHIAQVTLAAYECESLNFPSPPYPDEIICPENDRNPLAVTVLSIMSKVRLEAMCWGAGTALGELPPYFMARAARLSGIDPDDEDDDLKEFEELQRKQVNRNQLTLVERGKLFVEELVQKVGFFGILACASIPNPLFDLAGITCGHFLVPFWTFFGATLIGKAIIKMHIQKLFVIVAFNETLIVTALQWLKYIPVIGERLQVPFKAFLDGQKQKLHKGAKGSASATGTTDSGNILGAIFEKLMFAMILYFVISLVNALAQNYHKRIHKKTSKIAKD